MALVSVNAPRSRPQEEGTLDKVLKGIQITEGLLGVGLAIPKFLQDRAASKENSERETGKMTTAAYKAGFRPVEGTETKMVEGPGREDFVPSGGQSRMETTPESPMINQQGPASVAEDFGDKPRDMYETTVERGVDIPGLPGKWEFAGTAKGSRGVISTLQKTLPYDPEREYPQDSEVKYFPELGEYRVVPPDPTQMRADERAARMAGYTAVGVRRGSSAVLGKAINRGKLAGNAMVLIDAARQGVKGYEAQAVLDDPKKMAGLNATDIAGLRELAKHKFVPTEQFTYDLAMSLAAIMGGGNQPAYAMVEHMVPGNARADWKKLVQYLTANPQEYLNDKFLDHFEEAMQREIKYWGEQRDNMIAGIAHFMDPVFTRRKDLWESFRNGVEAAFHGQGNLYQEWLQKNYKYKDTHKESSIPAFAGSNLRLPKTDWAGNEINVDEAGIDASKMLEVRQAFSQSGQSPLQIDAGDLADALEDF